VIDMSVKVLTTGNWPNESKDTQYSIILPQEINSCIQSFNKFYNTKHTGRLLNWKNNLGFADLRAYLGESSGINNGRYEL